ncbi:Armadillo-like helical [Corchorus olitorius]|uniref:Armadillo-like helical n=1 Tax=Corchorus olitorius TaxID=93759 RepID=A0A1R3JX13_9ROSI|nr:Armadillo-like helical [Corchorus olitorius]
MREQKMTETQLIGKIAKIFDEAKTSNATHHRKLKELSAVRSKSPSLHQFSAVFAKTLTPLFQIQKRTASAERVVRFVSAFASGRDPNDAFASDEFLEDFLKFLLLGAKASHKTARFRACQIISEIILRLPDDSEVSNELWDEVIEFMKSRVADKVPLIRTLAVRALSRFVSDSENSDVLDLFLEVLPLEQNSEVRRTIVLSLPPSNATFQVIVDCTMDVSESVRKAAYCVIANKFPLQSLSIKHRTIILQRGLNDRSMAVSKECLKLMTDQWLAKCCNGDPVELLKYLDVETYESVGESVMESLLRAGLVKLKQEDSIQEYILPASTNDESEGDLADYSARIQLMEPEAKSSDAAATMGTEAAVYAAEASDNHDLLDRILPQTVSDYIDLVKAHIDAGWLDDEGNKVVIGDGINLGGDRDWATAVVRLARKVHSATGEFEDVILGVVEELARPCRERTADFIQWMHSLAAKHVHLDVQRVALRCLGLFGLLENKPSEELIKQLRISFVKGPSPISAVACKALFDLGMWHSPQEVDRAIGQNLCTQLDENNMHSSPKCLSKAFITVIRSMWPGLNDHSGGSSFTVSNMRKCAVQASRFMLHMMQAPLYAKETEVGSDKDCKGSPDIIDVSAQPSVECREEGLAIRIATEVLRFQGKKTPAERSYVAALCRILGSIHFQLSEPGPLKIMRRLLSRVCECVLGEKDILKELKQMAKHLQELDKHPDQDLSEDEAKFVFGRLDLEFNLDVDGSTAVPQTPAACSTRPSRLRRRVKREVSSDEENSPASFNSTVPIIPGTRSQRASKTAALAKMTASKAVRIEEDSEEAGDSDVTSEESDELSG